MVSCASSHPATGQGLPYRSDSCRSIINGPITYTFDKVTTATASVLTSKDVT